MKLKKSLYVSIFVIPMLLIGCSGGESSNTGGSTGTQVIPTTDSSTPSNNSSSNGDNKQDIGKIDYADSRWDVEVKDLMVRYLGGNIIPYVGLNGPIEAKYVDSDPSDGYRSYVSLTGGTFVTSYLDTAKVEFKKYSYDATILNDEFSATNDYLNLGVSLTKDENGLFLLKAYYYEPFDSDNLDDWTSSTKASLKTYFGKYDIPFVYLGAINYGESYEHKDKSVATFVGGMWDDEVIDLFSSAYSNYTIVRDSENPTHYIATREYSNGSIITADLSMVNNKAQLTLTLSEAFDDSMQDEWPSSIVEDAKTVLNNLDSSTGSGLTLPYVYLGTVLPSEGTFTTRKLEIKGEIWGATITEKAKASFVAAGWSETLTEGAEISFSKVLNKVTYTAVLERKTEGGLIYPLLTVRSAEDYEKTGYTSWSNNNRIRMEFRKKFGGSMQSMDTYVPYVYLGASDSALFVSTEYSTDSKMVIVGGKFNDQILDDFDSAYSDDDGWVVASSGEAHKSEEFYEHDSFVYRVAVKEFDNGNGTISVYTISLFSLYSGEDETACLEITKSEDWANTTEDWTSGAKSLISSTLGSEVEIPFFYTGRDSSELRVVDGTLSIVATERTGYFGRLQWDAYKAFSTAGWNISLARNQNYFYNNCTIAEIYATKTYSDSTGDTAKTVYVDLLFSGETFLGTLGIVETYDKENASGSYGSTLLSAMTSAYGEDFSFPYIYLGTNYPTYEYDSTSKTFTIWGGDYDSRIIDDAEATFKADETYDNISKYSTGVKGVYTLTATASVGKNGKDSLSVTIDKSLTSGRVFAKLLVMEGFDPTGAGTEWQDNVKQTFEETLGSVDAIPYFYMGSITAIAKDTTSMSGYTTVLTLNGGIWDSQINTLAKTAFDASSGWTSVITEASGSGSGSKQFHAYKFLEDGSAYRLKLYRGSSSEAVLEINYDLKNGIGDVASDWSTLRNGSDITNAFTNAFNGNVVPAFVYGGRQDEDVNATTTQDLSSNNNHIIVWSSGSKLVAQYVYNAKVTLEKNGYETEYTPFGKFDLPTLSASKDCEDGGTITIYYQPYKGSISNGTAQGYDLYMMYHPNFDTSNPNTDWSTKTKTAIGQYVEDGVLPYFNMGTNSPKVTWQENRHELELRAYAYHDGELETIKQKFIDGGWSMYDSYVYDSKEREPVRTYGGHFEIKDTGHVYLVNIEKTSDSHRYYYVTVTITVCF